MRKETWHIEDDKKIALKKRYKKVVTAGRYFWNVGHEHGRK